MWYIPVIEKGEYSKTLTNRRYIMDPIVWRTISHIAVFAASGLALMGGIGTWYFGNKVEKIMLFRQPILAASATVEVIVASDEQVNAHYMDAGGNLILGKGNHKKLEGLLLMLHSQDSWANQLGEGRVRYRGIFNMDVNDVAAGKPVNHLSEAEFALIFFKMLPTEKKVLGGKAAFTINNDVRFDINIPEQKPFGGIIVGGDLSEAFSNFEQ